MQYSDDDMAAVGRNLMEALDAYKDHQSLKGWGPCDCPSEVVGDLLGCIDTFKTQRNEALLRIEHLNRAVIKAAAPDFLTEAERDALNEFVEFLRSTEKGHPNAE